MSSSPMSAPTMRSASPALINAEGGHAVANVADVACIDEVQAAVACAVDTFGDLHFAVNNAGIGGDQSPGGNWTLPPGAG